MYDRSPHLPSARAYNSVWQLRVDVWSSIADLAKRLSDPALTREGRADPERELTDLIELVAPFETYWADPGSRRVGQLREMFAAAAEWVGGRKVEPIPRPPVG